MRRVSISGVANVEVLNNELIVNYPSLCLPPYETRQGILLGVEIDEGNDTFTITFDEYK